MWTKIAEGIIKYRLIFLILIALSTAYMLSISGKAEMSYDYLRIIPAEDEDMVYLTEFKKKFGEDGNMIIVGVQDPNIFKLETFNKYKALTDSLAANEGISEVLSLSRIKSIQMNDSLKNFELRPLFPDKISSQSQLDSCIKLFNDQKIYNGQFYNEKSGALLFVVSIKKQYVNTARRQAIVYEIINACNKFTKSSNIKIHFAGIPYVRSVMAEEVKGELRVFLALSAIVSALVLMFFFRSFMAVFVPMLLVGITVIWTLGTLHLFHYKITLLTGLIPSLVVITGIPNFIYLFNKYHQEFRRDRNKIQAITSIIKSIGFVSFLTNATTAVGFFVLINNDVAMLKEFGIIASINIMVAFVISMIFIPAVLAYLPEPTEKDMRHLDFNFLSAIQDWLHNVTLYHRKTVYVLSIIVSIISVVGIYKIRTISYMLDDVPDKLTLKSDLRFFEQNFKGIMPLEFVVDTKKTNGARKLSNLRKIAELETFLNEQKEISTPVSINTFLKGATQAYFDGDTTQYRLPSSSEAPFILKHFKKGKSSQTQTLMRSFVDSTGRYIRVSCKVADIGSEKLAILMDSIIKPKMNEIFQDTDISVRTTGTTLLFMKGNNMLINSLNSSILQSILFCTFLMALLFSSFRMIVISLIPNIIPLLITAAIMGFFNIPLKPSTAIIFSIVFGITVDNTIHYLAKYRYEIFHHKLSIQEAVLLSLRETGASQIYTSIVLFFGFIIYIASSFGGTIALGLLTSITLFTALIINLTLLPCLVWNFDRGRKEKDFDSFIEHFEDFYYEDEDEDIDIKQLEVSFANKK
ncbi:MAG: hypothetical protein RLZZ175_2442 [Bacteroidota bacterium]|jgi:predicted RND superfamily exporter protein